ncbi:hypothetical protein BC828DRAFT_413641 [Blastocladiella britannica]|nr:hypothetical protein BC828DRAFT_413641 [Blastocladiella britannica]
MPRKRLLPRARRTRVPRPSPLVPDASFLSRHDHFVFSDALHAATRTALRIALQTSQFTDALALVRALCQSSRPDLPLIWRAGTAALRGMDASAAQLTRFAQLVAAVAARAPQGGSVLESVAAQRAQLLPAAEVDAALARIVATPADAGGTGYRAAVDALAMYVDLAPWSDDEPFLRTLAMAAVAALDHAAAAVESAPPIPETASTNAGANLDRMRVDAARAFTRLALLFPSSVTALPCHLHFTLTHADPPRGRGPGRGGGHSSQIGGADDEHLTEQRESAARLLVADRLAAVATNLADRALAVPAARARAAAVWRTAAQFGLTGTHEEEPTSPFASEGVRFTIALPVDLDLAWPHPPPSLVGSTVGALVRDPESGAVAIAAPAYLRDLETEDDDEWLASRSDVWIAHAAPDQIDRVLRRWDRKVESVGLWRLLVHLLYTHCQHVPDLFQNRLPYWFSLHLFAHHADPPLVLAYKSLVALLVVPDLYSAARPALWSHRAFPAEIEDEVAALGVDLRQLLPEDQVEDDDWEGSESDADDDDDDEVSEEGAAAATSQDVADLPPVSNEEEEEEVWEDFMDVDDP